jgi:alcohol dehydrogenase
MENFNFQCGTKLIFGKDTESLVGEETKKYGKKVLLHYGSGSIKKTGLYDKVTSSLKKSGVSFIELKGVVPNPRLDLVNDGIKICKKEKVDFILAIGGGSVIDSAKAIAVGYYYEGDVWDFFVRKARIQMALPLGVILTLPAAGSESSPNSVISNKDRKLAIGTDLIRPKFAIMNPELTFTLPKKQTVAGIADMFAHIVERYFTNTKNTDLTDKMCEAVMRSIVNNGKLVVKEPDNYDYRAEIMLASTIAHNGILGMGREEDWASHRIEHELSAKYDVTHGEGLAVIVPAWMDHVYKHDVKRFAQYGKNVWGLSGNDEEIAVKSIDATKTFFKEIGLPTSLKEIKIDNKHFEEMANKCGPVGSFVKLNEKDIIKIYNIAL